MKKLFYFLLLLSFALAETHAQVVVNVGDDLIQKIAGADPGSTIIIKSGFHKAQYAGIKVDKNLTITGEDGKPKPKVYIKQIDVLGTDVSLTITGIDFSSAVFDSLTNTEDITNIQDSYFINLTTDLVSASDISVSNCVIHNFDRCVVRGDRAAYTVDNFTFDNCIIYDVHGAGDYGLFRFKSNITFGTFTLTKSTVYNFKNSIVNLESVTDMPESITVNQCTFDQMDNTKDGKSLFDIRKNANATAQMSIKNCIFGNVNKTTPELTYDGFRFTDESFNEFSYNIMATGFVVDTFKYDQVTWDKSQYNDIIDPDWESPDTGNFFLPETSDLLTLSEDGDIVGDPRWKRTPNSINNVDAFVFGIYPNPATTELNILLKQPATIAIYNSLGTKLTERYSANASLQTFDVSSFVAGVYFIRVNNQATQKFLIK